jgi:hypothetical protein
MLLKVFTLPPVSGVLESTIAPIVPLFGSEISLKFSELLVKTLVGSY